MACILHKSKEKRGVSGIRDAPANDPQNKGKAHELQHLSHSTTERSKKGKRICPFCGSFDSHLETDGGVCREEKENPGHEFLQGSDGIVNMHLS